MNFVDIIFWLSLACVAYVYIGYPLLLFMWSRLRPAPPQRRPFTGSFTIVMSAHNEESAISRRLEGLGRLIRESGLSGEIVLVSDGSTDATAPMAQESTVSGLVRVLELRENVGKAAALTLACESIPSDVIVFADVRQTWADDALVKLLENFADPRVGAVSGDLILQSADGVLAGVGVYWRFEKWLRKTESLIWSQVGVTGAISAVRRALFQPIPQGTMLDDVYWPLQVAMQGYRVIHDERAIAYDRLPDRPRDEFRRKVRTLSGNYQLAWLLPGSLLPWRNPVWLAWVSHKLLRLVVPWALLAMLAISGWRAGGVSPLISAPGLESLHAPSGGLRPPLAQIFAICQLAGYTIALLGLIPPVARRFRLAAAAGSFLVLNAAAGLAFGVAITGRASKSWHKISYNSLRGTLPVGPAAGLSVGSGYAERP